MKDKILGFIRETFFEMKKVSWPNQRYVMAATTIVLVLEVLTVIYVTVVDFAFAEIFKVLLK